MSDTEESAVTPSRSLSIAAIAFLLMSVPFFIFGLGFLDSKARIVLECKPGGPCILTRAGWLTEEEVGTFPLDELQEARVDRRRATRGDVEDLFRPVLVTSRGDFPLSYEWMTEESEASRVTRSINRFRARGGPGFTIWHDHRLNAGRLGFVFTITGSLVLAFGMWLSFRASRRRREEKQALG